MSATPTSFGWRCCRPAPRAAWWWLTRRTSSPMNAHRITATLAAAQSQMGAWRDADLVSAEGPRHAFALEGATKRKLGIPKIAVDRALVVRQTISPASIMAQAFISSIRPTPSRRRCRLCWKPCAPCWRRRGIGASSRPIGCAVEVSAHRSVVVGYIRARWPWPGLAQWQEQVRDRFMRRHEREELLPFAI